MSDLSDLRPPGWTTRVERGGGVATLHYDDHPDLTDRIGIEHQCQRRGTPLARLIAPFIRTGPDGHRVVQSDPLTITPSILCVDCGLHGFITEGIWRDAGGETS